MGGEAGAGAGGAWAGFPQTYMRRESKIRRVGGGGCTQTRGEARARVEMWVMRPGNG